MDLAIDDPARAGSTVEPRRSSGSEPSSTGDGAGPHLLSGRWLRLFTVGFALVLVVGAVLRFWTRSALWLDEALTVDIAKLPLHDLHAALRRDGAPPLYYVLLHFWIRAFGSSDVAVRSLSGVISLLTLPVAWFGARQLCGKAVAWVVVILLASAPFSVYYATEARMYALVMFLTACGIWAIARALDRPRPGNLVAVAVVTAALLYSQYWAIYLVGTVGIALLWQQRRSVPAQRRMSTRWTLGALVVGCLAFVPWVPTFVFQSRHTGTPWAAPPNFTVIINSITGFADNQATLSAAGSNQGRLLAVCYFVLAFLGLFGLARDRWHIELDIRTRPLGRPLAFVVGITLATAVAGGIIDKSAFSSRYAAVVFVPLLLLVGVGTLTLADERVRNGVLAVAAVAGLALSVENVWTQRTQATKVAAVLATRAQPGDVVAYCPDQLGPAVYRLTAGNQLDQITYPRRAGPAFVDWVDYKQAVKSASPQSFAQFLEQRAGSSHRIWVVWAPGYQGFGIRCETIVTALTQTPGYTRSEWVNLKPGTYYEPMQLTQFVPSST
jgi:4-amino-4-deoxy-L-arabinose transferase-like glycosyltransferase